MAKAVFSPCDSLLVADRNLPKNPTLLHFSPHYHSSSGQYLSFLIKNNNNKTNPGCCCWNVIWEYSHLIWVTTGMAVSTNRTLFPDLFSHGMVPSVLEVSLHSSKTAGRRVLWTWELGPDGKRSIFPQWNLNTCSIKLSRKTHSFLFLFISITALVKFLCFWKKQASCHFLLGNHLIVPFHLFRKQQLWQSAFKEHSP